MKATLKRIVDMCCDDIQKVLFYDNMTMFEKSEHAKTIMAKYFDLTKSSAIHSIDLNNKFVSSAKLEEFIRQQESFLNNWTKDCYNMLEKTSTLKINQQEFIKEFNGIVIGELQYMFKNVQLIVAKELAVNFDFIVHDSACDICKFLLNNKAYDKLEEHFLNDECDSYIELRNDFFETTNLISDDVKIYDVPVRMKKSIATFYKLLLLKFNDKIKKGVKIRFVNAFVLKNKKYENISDILNFCFDEEKNEYLIKFDFNTYRQYLLKAILNIKTIPEKISNLYYYKTSKDVIFPDDRFITYLAGQNEENYFVESCVLYILHPNLLYELDNKVFPIIKDYFEQDVE